MNGATIWARDTINSDIFFYKPDKWFKIWFYIVNRVNHKDNKLFKRGEALITHQELINKTKATRTQVYKCLKWMKKDEMIDARKTTRGMIISLKNYNKYQKLDNYKTSQQTSSRRVADELEADTINKNVKNDKNIRKYISTFNNLFFTKYKETSGRTKKLALRLKVYSFKDILTALNNLASSDFHRGKNDRGWKADPDFLIRSDEMIDKWLNYKPEKKKVINKQLKELYERLETK